MRIFHSLHAKILLGYCLVGGLFVVLVASALVQFIKLQTQLSEQRKVTVFYDAVRSARRMEKNFLLYRKPADLAEAIEKATVAQEAFEGMPLTVRERVVTPEEAGDVAHYRELLLELAGRDKRKRIPQEVQDDLYIVGGRLLQSGEALGQDAGERLDRAVDRHERNLLATILAAVILAVVAGALVTRSVVRPLRAIEGRLSKVARGETGRIEGEEQDSEVRSLAASINSALVELENRQQLVARSSRLVALGTMLSGVAHELNNPLSNISSSCQILMEEIGEISPQAAGRLLSQIDDQVLRAQRIVSALLNFSRDRDFVRRRERLGELVEEAVLLVRGQLPGGARLEILVPPDIGIDVEKQRFQQVLVNLIKNAAEAIAADGSIILSAWRESFPEGQGTTIEVEDTGHGIVAADLPHVFDPFFTTKPVGKGTGLGLFVAHEIVAQHGGTLSVTSEPGKWTRFWMHIPDVAEEADNG
ncbi:MAG: sensor histidine kinase [Betaproteobacteria bacterium]